ncbi:MAG: hypothetical protein RJA17_1294 [Pseudomonadota bacterium]
MLSRLADHLFWMSRYIERAENTARLLDVQHQSSMLPGGQDLAHEGWRAVLTLSELDAQYWATHDRVTPERVLNFMVADTTNPSSIASCLRAARENARAVRVVLAPDLWEAVNSSWLESQSLLRTPGWIRDPSRFFEWVKLRSHLCRGVMIGTMLKDEAFFFSRIGTFLERADNTARILDIKYVSHATGGASAAVGRNEFYFWASVLRSVSAFEIYRKVYRDVVTPLRIAELLIQRADMPRSLLACLNELMVNLDAVSAGQRGQSLRIAGRMQAELQYLTIDAEFAPTIHLFLTNFLAETHRLGLQISEEFLVPIAATA